jgi:hypothetical protein
MKKLSILVLALFYIGIADICAQTETNINAETTVETVKEKCSVTENAEGKLVCAKTGKACESTCKKKKTKSCCKGKKESTCSKSKNGFNFNKSNNYSKNASKNDTKKAYSKNDANKNNEDSPSSDLEAENLTPANE